MVYNCTIAHHVGGIDLKTTVTDKHAVLNSKSVRFIIISSICACVLLYVIEQVLAANYLIKTLAKILLFASTPYGYASLLGSTSSQTTENYKAMGKLTRSLKAGLLLGIAAFGIILATYALLQGALDLPTIAQELQEKSQVTPTNFLLVGLYITFGNSFLEELFFRGFIFRALHGLGKTKLAYWFSSLLFGVYHIAIFQTWFSPWLIGLALLALVSVGLIFNWLNVKANHFYNSWLAHILADAAIILVGLRMFEII